MAAKRLACRLICYDGDFACNQEGSCVYGDNLNGAIRDLIEIRFIPMPICAVRCASPI